MALEFQLPKISANVESETLTAWLKNEGDHVKAGEPLVEVTTEKACVEVESPCSGVLRRILAPEKSILPVGYIIAIICDDAGEPLPDVSAENEALMEKLRASSGRKRRKRAGRSAGREGRVRATPAARRRARELGIDLSRLKNEDVEVVTETMVEEFHAANSS
ncbi:MAG: biotin/lipoyl-containing protein [Kiritimatiellia bacterium]|nr:biotin/lipoyl-containing protein [Kiritimatiellia bacterium]MDP6848606.1 biotin/lipoyl-containing protein [Kiritimatiellia bacterium]